MGRSELTGKQYCATFAQAFDPRRNGFGVLRLTLAILVIFSHSFSLGGFGMDPLARITHAKHTFGLVAVEMFFVVSGFLICRSATGAISTLRFLWHRFLRIFPGYWVCLVVCAIIFAPLAAWTEDGKFLRAFSAPHDSAQTYVLGNAGLLHLSGTGLMEMLSINPQEIAGLLRSNPRPLMINGSLWTLPFEVVCYLSVAVLAAVGVMRRARYLVLAAFVGLWSMYAFSYLSFGAFFQLLPVPGLNLLLMLATFFCAGCVCFLYREKIPHSKTMLVGCMLVLSASIPAGLFGLLAPIALTYACLWLAFSFSSSRFGAKGDFSYGTYIYAFPIQQGLSLLHVQEKGFAVYLLSSLSLTLFLAYLSYRLVETPCLRLKSIRPSGPRWLSLGQLRETYAGPPARTSTSAT